MHRSRDEHDVRARIRRRNVCSRRLIRGKTGNFWTAGSVRAVGWVDDGCVCGWGACGAVCGGFVGGEGRVGWDDACGWNCMCGVRATLFVLYWGEAGAERGGAGRGVGGMKGCGEEG